MFKRLFEPNKTLPLSATTILVVAQCAVLLLLWFSGVVRYVPTPLAILQVLPELLMQKGLLYHLWVSTRTVCEAMCLTILISLTLAYAAVLPFFRPVAYVASKLRFISIAGLTFFFVLLFGGDNIKLSLLTYGMSVFFVTNMLDVINDTKKAELDHARLLGMSEWRATYEVIVLGKLPYVLDIIRGNFAIAWAMLTLVEGVSRAEGGVGFLLNNNDKHFELPEMFATLLCIFIVGVSLDYFFGWLKRVVCPYANITLERG
jgi:NitT/TauT family transport system permease protein